MLNITNYSDHPTKKMYTVFRFFEKERADYFEQLLKEQNIWYENQKIEEESKTIYVFGTKKSDFKQTSRSNFLVNAKYREPFISNTFLRWFTLFFAMAGIFLAILGYLRT